MCQVIGIGMSGVKGTHNSKRNEYKRKVNYIIWSSLFNPSFQYQKLFKGVAHNTPYDKQGRVCGTFVVKARTPGASSCRGDDGGPFVCNINGQMKQFGVAAWAHNTCSSYAGYYPPHHDGGFIQRAIKELAEGGSSTKVKATRRNRRPSSRRRTSYRRRPSSRRRTRSRKPTPPRKPAR